MKKTLLLTSVFGLLASIVTLLQPPEASAAATSCEAKYSSAPVASDAAKAKATALLQSCKQGWSTDNCNDTPAGSGATRRERKAACDYGKQYRKSNPPASTTSKTPGSCSDITTNIISCNTNGGDPVTSLLLQILNFLAVGVGIAVLGGIVWGGILYASSNGDASKVNQGKTTIVNSIIGLLLFIFMYAILNFIVPGGLFR